MNEGTNNLFERYLSGKATANDEAQIEQILTSNDIDQMLFDDFVCTDTSTLKFDKQQQLLNNIHQQIQAPKTSAPLWRYWQKVAAILFLPLMLGLLYFALGNTTPHTEQFTTVVAERGQKTNVYLPDGTHVVLNSESQISYSNSYNQHNRTLTLSGEAYFEVAKNEQLAFTVQSSKMSVTALGTAFNVRAYPNEHLHATTLTHGKVQVQANNAQYELQPNQSFSYNHQTGKHNITQVDNAYQSIDWLNNQLTFSNASFNEIARSLSRIYNINFVVADTALNTYKFSGTINNNSIESALRILSFSSPLLYQINNDTIELFENKKESKYFK